MIPLILHHRIVDPFDITLTACAEDWHRDMNSRLIYDFILLILLFILPLTLMTFCYIRISFSLWFIDSNVQTSISASILNAARFSTISEDFPNDIRRSTSRPLYMHYHKTNENRPRTDDYRALLTHNRQRRNTVLNDNNNNVYRLSANKTIPRRFSENDYNHIQLNIQGRTIPIRQRHSISQYTSGLLRTSMTSLAGQNRILNGNNNNHHQRRSVIDFEHASRFLQSRRRVVKLLITLGKRNQFFLLLKIKLFYYFSNRLFYDSITIEYSLNLY
jgi:hypothetical protein